MPKDTHGLSQELACRWISDDIEQLLDTVAPDRCNNPELGKMGPDRIDHRSLLTDE